MEVGKWGMKGHEEGEKGSWRWGRGEDTGEGERALETESVQHVCTFTYVCMYVHACTELYMLVSFGLKLPMGTFVLVYFAKYLVCACVNYIRTYVGAIGSGSIAPPS